MFEGGQRVSIEQPEIDGEASDSDGVSATTNEASGGADGNRGARVDGSGATVATAETAISDDPLTVVVAALHGANMVNGEYDDSDGQWIVETKTWQYEDVARGILAAVVPLIRAQVADERLARLRSVTAPDDGLVKVGQWPAIADAGTAEFDRLWAELENGPPLPPASDETREHPADRQTEGAARREADRD